VSGVKFGFDKKESLRARCVKQARDAVVVLAYGNAREVLRDIRRARCPAAKTIAGLMQRALGMC